MLRTDLLLGMVCLTSVAFAGCSSTDDVGASGPDAATTSDGATEHDGSGHGNGHGGEPSHASDEAIAAARASLFDWQTLPVAQDRSYFQYSTRDRERDPFPEFDPKNKDFNNFVAVCGTRQPVRLQTGGAAPCDPGLDGYVLASDDSGPGFVSRIWFAGSFANERIRIFADDLKTPVYDAPLATWQDPKSDPFLAPLTTPTSSALVSYVPIAYQRKLRVLIDGLNPGGALYYNQTNVQHGQDLGRGFVLQSASELTQLQESVHAATGSEQIVDKTFEVLPQQTSDVLERTGSGVITQLRFTVAALSPSDLRSLVLRMTWERAEQPAVELPLSAFFGAEIGVGPYQTLPLSAARASADSPDITLEANWPLPYFEHVRISLENTGAAARSVVVRVSQGTAAPAAEAGHFHALYKHSVGPFETGARYQVATLEGAGKYVGTMVYMQGTLDAEAVAARYALGFLEGDERIVVDGSETVLGTGTEDYFDAGYYWGNGRFDHPFATLITKSEDANGGSVTAARWHVLTNSIEFKESLDFSFEYGADRPKSATDYASVAYYYLFD